MFLYINSSINKNKFEPNQSEKCLLNQNLSLNRTNSINWITVYTIVSIEKCILCSDLGFQHPLPPVTPPQPMVLVREQEIQGLIISTFGEFKVWRNLILRSDV